MRGNLVVYRMYMRVFVRLRILTRDGSGLHVGHIWAQSQVADTVEGVQREISLIPMLQWGGQGQQRGRRRRGNRK